MTTTTTNPIVAMIRHAAHNKQGGTFVKALSSCDWHSYDVSCPKHGDTSVIDEGYFVGIAGGIVVPKLRKVIVEDFIKFNSLRTNTWLLGFWFDPDTELWNIDNVFWASTHENAITHAIKWEQKAIYDIKNQRVEYVKGI